MKFTWIYTEIETYSDDFTVNIKELQKCTPPLSGDEKEDVLNYLCKHVFDELPPGMFVVNPDWLELNRKNISEETYEELKELDNIEISQECYHKPDDFSETFYIV